MTPAPLPTPYDITPLPGLPLVPPLALWGVLLLLAALVTLLIAGLPRLRRRIDDTPAFSEALAALRRSESSQAPLAERLAQSSLAARRLLTTLSGVDLSSLTATELKAQSALPPPLWQVAEAISALEVARFRAGLTEAEAIALTRSLAKTLRDAATKYRSGEVRP